MNAPRALVLLAWAQGAYFAVAGAWPLVHMDSFLLVTGPKTDLWLVRAVAVLVLVIGLALLLAAWRLRVGLQAAILAVGSALGLAAIEIVHVLDGTIRVIYAADAALEIVLALAWVLAAWRAGPSWWASGAQVRGRAS